MNDVAESGQPIFLSFGMIFSSQGKSKQARAIFLGQVDAQEHDMRPRNCLDTKIAFLLLISHLLGDLSHTVLTDAWQKAIRTKILSLGKAVHESIDSSTGFMSTTGVLSIASIGPTNRRPECIRKTFTR